MKARVRHSNTDSATVVAAINAKIAYSLAATESVGSFTGGPPAVQQRSRSGYSAGNLLTLNSSKGRHEP